MNKYRNKKLTQSAQHEACVNCGANDGTIVWAHSNSLCHGKGTGTKAHDIFGAFLCVKCHSIFDAHDMPRTKYYCETLEDWFLIMWEKSMIIACEKGYL
jgi:hypothetical protein